MLKIKNTEWFLLLASALLSQGCVTTNSNQVIEQTSAFKPIKNILFIAVDDLRPELNSFGARHIHSPNIDGLAQNGRIFLNHFVNAPSCGPSRYSLLMGRYGPYSNNALKSRSQAITKNPDKIPQSMPAWFKSQGYKTVSVGKISNYPGGLMGKNWDDITQLEMPNAWTESIMPVGEWHTPKGAMHGLAHGEIRVKPSEMDVFQAAEGDDNIYPDGLITNEAVKQIQRLTKAPQSPFFLAVGIIRPHLPFGAPKKYLDLYEDVEFPAIEFPHKPQGLSSWSNSHEFRRYNRWGKDPLKDEAFAKSVRRHYAASVSYADAQVGKILRALEATGADENTVVVLWGDHGWNLGEHGMWGKHNLYEEALRSPLIIAYPTIPEKGHSTEAVVETVDIFPTLTKITGVPSPKEIHGKSIIAQVNDPSALGHSAYAYWRGKHTLRIDNFRLTRFGNKGYALYDIDSKEKETKNVADKHPDLTHTMIKELENKTKMNDKF